MAAAQTYLQDAGDRAAQRGQCALGRAIRRRPRNIASGVAADAAIPEALLQMAQLEYQRQNYLLARAFLERYLSPRRSEI